MTNRLTSFQHQFMHRALALLVYACLHLSVSIYGQTPPDSEEKLSQLQSLRGKPIPSPSQLDQFIADHQATIQLGKALFWDVQAGSDGRTACATCHYHAGADSRGVNTLAPPLLAQGGSIPPCVLAPMRRSVMKTSHFIAWQTQTIGAHSWCAARRTSLVRREWWQRHL